jgi:hypothetical protein
MRPVTAFFVAMAYPIAFGLGAIAQDVRTRPASPERHSVYEDTAVYMIRLGMMRWNGACFYQAAKEKVTSDQAEKICAIDLHLDGKEPASS